MVRNLSASLLFWAGTAALPAFLMQDSLPIRVFQVVLFGVLTALAGKRLLWGYFFTLTVTITIFHLIVPSGAVLFEVGAFRVTLGALQTGLFKSLTILGMVFLSLVAVRADLRLPGRLGSLVGKIFWCFEQIMERRGERQHADLGLVARADALLDSLYSELIGMDDQVADTQARKATASRSTLAGLGIAVLLVGAQWAALLVPA